MKTTYNLKDLTATEAISKGPVLFKAWKEYHAEQDRIERRRYAKERMLQAIANSAAKMAGIAES